MRHIPNVLSAIRLILVGVFIFLFARAKYLACLIVFLTAFFTDLLDGYLARRNNWISDLGKVLDPLADKLMVIAALSCFYSALDTACGAYKRRHNDNRRAAAFPQGGGCVRRLVRQVCRGLLQCGRCAYAFEKLLAMDRHAEHNSVLHCDSACGNSPLPLCKGAGVQPRKEGILNRHIKGAALYGSFFLPLPALCSRIALCGGGFWGIICVGTPMRACMRA